MNDGGEDGINKPTDSCFKVGERVDIEKREHDIH
jgi:hypothetical protein